MPIGGPFGLCVLQIQIRMADLFCRGGWFCQNALREAEVVREDIPQKTLPAERLELH